MRKEYFKKFCMRHENFNPIWETSNLLIDSYIMISPDGRFYQNTNNYYSFSDYILDMGVKESIRQLDFSLDKYLSYDE